MKTTHNQGGFALVEALVTAVVVTIGMLMIGQSDQSSGLCDVARRYMPMVVWGERSPDSAYCTVGVDNVCSALARRAPPHIRPHMRPTSDPPHAEHIRAPNAVHIRRATRRFPHLA